MGFNERYTLKETVSPEEVEPGTTVISDKVPSINQIVYQNSESMDNFNKIGDNYLKQSMKVQSQLNITDTQRGVRSGAPEEWASPAPLNMKYDLLYHSQKQEHFKKNAWLYMN